MEYKGDPESPTGRIALRMRRLRREREWSQECLAEEMTHAGINWSLGTVTKLENGYRESVTVDELLALGAVFNVEPMTFLAKP